MSVADDTSRPRVVVTALAVSGAALLGFIGWTLFIRPSGEPPAFDWDIARSVQAFAEGHELVRAIFVGLTFLGGVPFMIGLGAAGVLTSLARGQRALALGWLMAAAVGGLLDLALKTSLDRLRPPVEIRDIAVHETNESYPSGHAMGSIIGFGMLGYAACYVVRRLRWRTLLVLGLATLIALIGVSRIILRAHWFSDVIGGFLIGGSWLALWIAAVEWMHGRAAQQKSPGA